MNRTKLHEELRRDEGTVPHAYQDSLGYWTIGIGRLIDKRKGGRLTDEEIEYLLENDVLEVERLLDKYLPWWKDLSDVRQRVIVNMGFNLGVGPCSENPEGKLLTFKSMLKAMESGNVETAVANMANTLWAKQVGKRADRLMQMWREG